MANKIRFGLKNLHVAFRGADVVGEPSWGDPVALPGGIGLTRSPVGDKFELFADNTVHFTSTVNNGYDSDLEVALIPDAIKAQMLNWPVDDNGALIEDADALPAPFALMFQIEGDESGRRFVYYECRAARPDTAEKTKQSNIEARTETAKLSITPIVIGGRNTVGAELELSDTNATAYNAFFESVYTEAQSVS